jgi:hypothetical protein
MWGVYDIYTVRSFIGTDTLFKTFTTGNAIDSSKWAALYLKDENRPFSLSGQTMIRGNAYIPMSGVQEAYIDNNSYQGDKRLIIGNRQVSKKKMPGLDEKRLSRLELYLEQAHHTADSILTTDSIKQSFLRPSRFISFKKRIKELKYSSLSNNVVLFSDTTLIIDSTAVLNNIMVFAPGILVKSGFHGTCQLFATDSISVDSNCHFNYPSCLGILRFHEQKPASQAKITLGKKSDFSGLIFTYEKEETDVKPKITLEERVKIKGQVYSQGILGLKNYIEIVGSTFTSRFYYKNGFTLYENYLINATIDSKALSPYYLASPITPVASKKKKILQWLEAN